MPRLLLFRPGPPLPVAAQAADPAAYLPAETDAVLTIQARHVVRVRPGQEARGRPAQGTARGQQAGRRRPSGPRGSIRSSDFDVVTVGLDLRTTGPPKPFALFEGKFDAKKVEANVAAYMKEHPDQVRPVTVGGKAAYKVAGAKPAETMYAAVLDDTKLVVAPTEKDLAGAFAAAAGGGSRSSRRSWPACWRRPEPTAPIFLRAWVKGRFNNLNLPTRSSRRPSRGWTGRRSPSR